jgi:HEPN domain-containing protein
MDRIDLVAYWEETSDKDYVTMHNLYNSGDYHWSLFMGHIVLEKLLKACYVKRVDDKVPFTHDLLRLAISAGLKIDDHLANDLDFITTFNISARYPDYKQGFYRKCTKEFTEYNIERIGGVRIWLKERLRKRS